MAAPTAVPARRRFRSVEVTAVHRITPRMVSVSLSGDDLADFEITAPTQHVKLLFPTPGQSEPALPENGPDGLRFPDDRPGPVMRTFTPRRFRSESCTLDVEFVLHDDGPASAWAALAVPGQRIAVAGPGGRMPLALGPGHWVVADDESAIPAIGTLLGTLPGSARADVYLEVNDAADEMAMQSAATLSTTWLYRRRDVFGEALGVALDNAELTDATGIWVACEAGAVRRIRQTLLHERNVNPSSLVTRGYWRLGEQNYPDHDHGEDVA